MSFTVLVDVLMHSPWWFCAADNFFLRWRIAANSSVTGVTQQCDDVTVPFEAMNGGSPFAEMGTRRKKVASRYPEE
jgi:hypothetical protein